MKFRLTIGRKIFLGFGILIFLTVINFILTFYTLMKSERLNNQITQIYTPSVESLEELHLLMLRSKMLISNWVFIVSSQDNLEKRQLIELISTEYPKLRNKLDNISVYWKDNEKQDLKKIIRNIDSLFVFHSIVMNQLNTFESYEDALKIFTVRPMVEEGEIHNLTNKILDDLAMLTSAQLDNTHLVSKEMVSAFTVLQFIVSNSGVILIFGGVLIAIFTGRSIVNPIKDLRLMLLSLGKGIFPENKIKDRKDEIGEMSLAMDGLVEGLKRTTEFSREVGSGNFNSHYEPLSDQDILGQALLKMREELRENERILEAKVIERTEEVVKQKVEIEEKNEKLEVLYKDITDSIRYAKRIQESILPPAKQVKEFIPQSFILYKPKDIVSGDFYWFANKNEVSYIAAVDCTGHGVPGAFMSIVGYNYLNHALHIDSKNAASILDELNNGVGSMLHQTAEGGGSKDGMDVALCMIDAKRRKIQYAGAYNPLYVIRNNEIIETKADKFPIGVLPEGKRGFTNHEFDIQPGDTFYIFTDGYADQFGGPNGKKFMYKQFREILMKIHRLPFNEQKNILDRKIEEWKGNVHQLDDILVIGFTIDS